jgi:hypothetical protein
MERFDPADGVTIASAGKQSVVNVIGLEGGRIGSPAAFESPAAATHTVLPQ